MKKDTYAILTAVWCVGSLAVTVTGVKIACLGLAAICFGLQLIVKE